MQTNPAEDWRRLTEHYREMLDGELEELAADMGDLTETAQQVLRNEMQTRGLQMPRPGGEAEECADRPADARWASARIPDSGYDPANAGSAGGEGSEEEEPAHAYTWKTPLCECEDREQAWQVYEVLRRAGIESWIELPGSRYALSISNPRVVVAADQLEHALAIASQPIPQEIVDLSRTDVPEYEPPKCPACGAEDPILESAEPTNSWLCEACGKQWTEEGAGLEGNEEKTER